MALIDVTLKSGRKQLVETVFDEHAPVRSQMRWQAYWGEIDEGVSLATGGTEEAAIAELIEYKGEELSVWVRRPEKPVVYRGSGGGTTALTQVPKVFK